MSQTTPPSSTPRFSLFQLLLIVTLVIALGGAAAVGYKAHQTEKELNGRIQQLQQDLQQHQVDLRNARGDLMRSAFAEKTLFHVFSRSRDYGDLTKLLRDPGRKWGVSMHPLDETDNRALIIVATQDQITGFQQISQVFLVQEEPFVVMGSRSGQKFRMPTKTDGKWVFSLKEGDDYHKYWVHPMEMRSYTRPTDN